MTDAGDRGRFREADSAVTGNCRARVDGPLPRRVASCPAGNGTYRAVASIMSTSVARLLVAAGAIFAAAPANASSILGEWISQGYSAKVHIAPCAEHGEQFCGTIVWLWESVDRRGETMRDTNNPNPAQRSKPLVGLVLLRGLRQSEPGAWDGGTIYDPENGRTYGSRLRLRTDDILEVQGCVLFVCRTQLWRRPGSM